MPEGSPAKLAVPLIVEVVVVAVNVVVGKAIYENKITIESLAQFNA